VRRIHSTILVFVGLLSICATAQRPPEPQANSEFTTRFSYENTWNVSYRHTWDGLGRSGELRRLCFAFAPDGEYRILRQQKNSGPVEAFQGTLGKSRLERLQRILNSDSFLNLRGNGPGVLLNGAEAFVANILRQGRVQRIVWANRDGRNPFPGPIAGLMEWMRTLDLRARSRFLPMCGMSALLHRSRCCHHLWLQAPATDRIVIIGGRDGERSLPTALHLPISGTGG
jgi:hypothetical protein